MAKKKVRGSEREPSRATLKAIERRSVGVEAGARLAAEATRVVAPELAVTRQPTAPVRRGVLPSRGGRAPVGPATLSQEQELRYIRGDLARMVWLAVAMLALIVVLTFVVPLIAG